MGQYYIICNLDKKQYLHPHKFGDGLKLLEFGSSGCGTMTALAILLADGNNRGGGDLRSNNPIVGSWAGDKIVVAGDYADPDRWGCEGTLYERSENPILIDGGGKAHDMNENWDDISDKVIEAMSDDDYLKSELIRRASHGWPDKEVAPALFALKNKTK